MDFRRRPSSSSADSDSDERDTVHSVFREFRNRPGGVNYYEQRNVRRDRHLERSLSWSIYEDSSLNLATLFDDVEGDELTTPEGTASDASDIHGAAHDFRPLTTSRTTASVTFTRSQPQRRKRRRHRRRRTTSKIGGRISRPQSKLQWKAQLEESTDHKTNSPKQLPRPPLEVRLIGTGLRPARFTLTRRGPDWATLSPALHQTSDEPL